MLDRSVRVFHADSSYKTRARRASRTTVWHCLQSRSAVRGKRSSWREHERNLHERLLGEKVARGTIRGVGVKPSTHDRNPEWFTLQFFSALPFAFVLRHHRLDGGQPSPMVQEHPHGQRFPASGSG